MRLTKLNSKSLESDILKFINFYLKKLVYKSHSLKKSSKIRLGIDQFLLDYSLRKHNTVVLKKNNFFDQLQFMQSGLIPVMLYRIAKNIIKDNLKNGKDLVSLNRILCSVEIYLNSEIDSGFNIDHGYGSVIGSRSKIGKNFLMHSNCVVGHKLFSLNEKGPNILNNVTMCVNSTILGPVTVKNNYIVKPFEVYS